MNQLLIIDLDFTFLLQDKDKISQQSTIDQEFINFLMEGFGSSTFLDFDYVGSTPSPMANNESVTGPGTPVAAPVPDANLTDMTWGTQFKDLENCDLLETPSDIFGIKSFT